MSGGGQTTSTTSNAPPQEFLDAYKRVVGQAQNVAATPYQAYPGQIVAPFSPDQTAAQDIIRNSQGVSFPYINTASGYFDQSTSPLTAGVAQLAPSQQGELFNAGRTNLDYAAGPQVQNAATAGARGIMDASGSFTPASIAAWESPYTNDVVNATMRDFAAQNEQQRQGVVGNAISRGAFGGDRSAVAEALLAGEQNRTQAPVLAGLRNQGYLNAANEAQQNAALRTQGATAAGGLGYQGAATTAGMQSDVARQLLGLFGNQQSLGIGTNQAQANLLQQAGYGMAGLGREAQSGILGGASALGAAGTQQQQQAQALLNVPYQQYLAAQQYPFQTTGWLANISSGLGGAAGGTQTSSQPAPSGLSQAAGLGMTGAGLIGATGGFGSNGWLSGMFNGGGGGIADVPFDFAHGGGVPHRAGGGPLGGFSLPGIGSAPLSELVPDAGISPVPSDAGAHGTPLISRNYGSTTTASREGGIMDAVGPLMTVAKLATLALAHGGGIAGHGIPRRAQGGIAAFANDNADPFAIPSVVGQSPFTTMHPGMSRMGVPTLGGMGGGTVGFSPADGHALSLAGMTGGPSVQSYLNDVMASAYRGAPNAYVPPAPMSPVPQAADTARKPTDAELFGVFSHDGGDGGGDGSDSGGDGDGAGFRGGNVYRLPKRADGGDLPDDDADLPVASNDVTDGGLAAASDVGGDGGADGGGGDPESYGPPMAPPLVPRGAPGVRASGSSLPLPPPPPPQGSPLGAAPPSGGIAGPGAGGNRYDPNAQEKADRSQNLWQSLLYAGLGTMGGTSRNALTNIGRGALTGLEMGSRDAARQEQARARKEQAETNRLWRVGQLGINQQKADTQGDLAGQRIQLMQAQAAMAMARAAHVGASHATEGDILAGAVKSLVGQPNPDNDGKPYSTAEAYRMVKGIQGREDNNNRKTAIMEGREDRLGQAADARATAAEKSQEYRDAMLALRQSNVGEVNARAVLNGATNLMRNDPTGKLTFAQALTQSKQALADMGGTIGVPVEGGGRAVARGARAGTTGGASAPAPVTGNLSPAELAAVMEKARDAIARGAPRDKVIERLKAAGINASDM